MIDSKFCEIYQPIAYVELHEVQSVIADSTSPGEISSWDKSTKWE